MECIVEHNADIERTQKRIYHLLTQCIEDIEKAVRESGLNIEEVGTSSKNSRQAWILSSMV